MRSEDEVVLASLEFACLVPFEVVDLVAIAIDEHRASRSHDGRTAITAVELHSLAALALPGNHLVFVFEAGHKRVIKLPVIFEMISAARRSNSLRIIDAQRPAADIDFVRAIVQRFAGAIDSEPVPVIRMHIVFIRTARRRALPQIPIKLRRHGRFFAGANRLPHIAVPGFREVRPADDAGVNFFDDLDGVW